MSAMKQRTSIPEKERELRSELHKMLSTTDGFLHGTLISMARKCGNSNCKCAKNNEKHVSLYLGQTQNRKTKMEYIPKELENSVQKWVENFEKAKNLLEKICQEKWKSLKIKKQKKN